MAPPLARFDRRLLRQAQALRLIGVDEVGRGPLAGPVVACAVELPSRIPTELLGIDDSKALSPSRRELLYFRLRARGVRYAAAWAGPREIERINILRASLEAMRRAAAQLGITPETVVVVDGDRPIEGLGCSQRAIVGGDRRSWSTAAASVIAKVVRDRWMGMLDRTHPGYGFGSNKGYGTARHLEALRRLGPCPIHRRSYAPVAQLTLALGAA